MSKLLRLSRETGEKWATYAAVAVGTGIGACTLGAHTVFMDNYAGLFQLYDHGFEAVVPKELETMLSEASEDLGIPIKKPVTKLFGVIGFDVMHFGSTLANTGALIGIPVSFFYKSKDDIDRDSVQVAGKSVPWSSMDGERLENSFVMSDLAKKYAIAYELALADTPKLYLHSLCAPVTVIILGQINNYFCNVFGLPHRPFVLKGIFYSLLTIFGFGIYFSLKDLTTQYYELNALERVSEAGENYVIGGISFYEKLLEKHKALRNLLPGGRKDYTTYGDPIYLLRKKHVPPTELRSLLDEKLNNSKPSEILQESVA